MFGKCRLCLYMWFKMSATSSFDILDQRPSVPMIKAQSAGVIIYSKISGS